MTDAELQAEIDLEAARIRAWQDFEVRQDIRSVGILDDRLIEGLASHLVRNRAVVLQVNTLRLVEAARATKGYLNRDRNELSASGLMLIIDFALIPFEKGEGT